jgi:hypothetical protein
LDQFGGFSKALQSSFFAWHGTAAGAIAPICNTGFDPSRRSGQAYGPGEYFGWTASVSHGYCRGGTNMLVAVILKGSHVHERSGFCYVVNNPKDWSFSYCLPLLVISYNTSMTTPPAFLRAPKSASTSSSSPSTSHASLPPATWNAPFRWHWAMDNGKFEPYNDDINSLLETYYDQYKRGGASSVTTPPLIRYVDDIPQPYHIDFANNIQTNCKTGYRRNIMREEKDVLSSGGTAWYYQDDSGGWRRYESMIEGQIQQRYLAYLKGGPSVVSPITFPGRPESYELDFVKGTQKNLSSQTSRRINRSG